MYFVKKIMKQTCSIFCVMIFSVFFSDAKAQSEAEMKKWMEYMTPAEVQKMIAKWDGEWNEAITMWQAPGAPEQKMEATCVNKMILGGRYQEARHSGNFMGMPFEAIGTLGWDNAGKKFVNSWIDNMGTGIAFMEGTWDEASKSAEMRGKMTDPMTGNTINIRQVLKIIDDNTQEVTQYTTNKEGKEFKNMLITLKRKK
jgi:hypothetical protein